MVRRPFRALRLALLMSAMLIVPGSAIAAKIEPVGSPPPTTTTLLLTGSDHYGAVSGKLVLQDADQPQTVTLTYANACSARGVTLEKPFEVDSDGLFSDSEGGYAVSGIVTHQATGWAVSGAVVSSHVCRGAAAPVIFQAATGS